MLEATQPHPSMKTMTPKSLLPLLAIAFAGVLLSSSLSAAILVSENYDSKALGDLIGQNSALGSTGLTGNYIFNGAGLNTSQSYNVVAGGLAFSSYSGTSGNSLQATSSNTGATAVAGLSLAASPYTGTLYSSYLINFSALSTSGGFASTRITPASGSVGSASRFNLGADTGVNSAINPGIAYDNATTAAGTNLTINTTYMMIGRFTNVGTALSGSTEGVATMFALTAAQWDSFIAGGGTDSYLDGATVGTAAGEISARVADAAVTTGTYSFANGNFVQLVESASTTGSTQTYKFDNMLYGTSLADVSVIPEPSTAILGAVGALALLLRRRRRI